MIIGKQNVRHFLKSLKWDTVKHFIFVKFRDMLASIAASISKFQIPIWIID